MALQIDRLDSQYRCMAHLEPTNYAHFMTSAAAAVSRESDREDAGRVARGRTYDVPIQDSRPLA